jgi:ABC-type maltose transport system permease subunit
MSVLAVLAANRTDESLNFPLLVHVFGAMVLVGGLVTAASALAFARGDPKLLRLGYWTLLAVSLPGYVIMRIGAQWIYSKENWDDVPDKLVPSWIDIGFIVADAGALLMIIALIVGGIGMRRLRQGKGQGLLKATLVIAIVILAAALVAVWAMAGKPT